MIPSCVPLLCSAGVDTISLSRLVNASVTSYTLSISEWPMGSYEVTVSSVAGSVRGNPTGRSTFVVGKCASVMYFFVMMTFT